MYVTGLLELPIPIQIIMLLGEIVQMVAVPIGRHKKPMHTKPSL